MSNRKWYEWMLTVIYIAMAGLCVYLNFTKDHKESLATIIVNIIMFIIVAVIFISTDFSSFAPMNRIIRDLIGATDKIRRDAMNTHSYLYEPYQSNKVELFSDETLREIFQDYLFELNRQKNAEDVYYRPNIDNYINEELVDNVMHRNELNQVAGMLTGLGILGTFIGLSLGLQNFNTGTTAQMTESIEPLMNGIKVAFHTSIYGMVFSLTFNTIYKKKLFEAEAAVRNFVSVFKKYVLPDTENDGMNQLIALEEEQLDAIKHMTKKIAAELNVLLEPQFDRLNDTIVDFENMATRNQEEALHRIVNSFVEQMNQSLGQTFANLNQTVEDQYKLQQNNAGMMQEILAGTGSTKENLLAINTETEKLIKTLDEYSESITTVQSEMRNTVSTLRRHNESTHNSLLKERDMLGEQEIAINNFKNTVAELAKYSKDTYEHMDDSLEELTNGIDYICRALDKLQQAKSNSKK